MFSSSLAQSIFCAARLRDCCDSASFTALLRTWAYDSLCKRIKKGLLIAVLFDWIFSIGVRSVVRGGINGNRIHARQRMEAAEPDRIALRRPCGKIPDDPLAECPNAKTCDARRHLNLGEELLHPANARTGTLLIRPRINP